MFVPFDSELMGSSHISGGKKWARAIPEKQTTSNALYN